MVLILKELIKIKKRNLNVKILIVSELNVKD